MFNWFKKKETFVKPEEPINVVQPTSELNALDYPKSQYKVYWETHLFEHPEGPWVAEVRFIGHNGNDHRVTDSVTGTSKDHVQKLVNKLIKEKMEGYKWH